MPISRKESYAVFKRLQDAGKIPAGTRFQVDLVPAHSVIWLFLADALHAPIDPIYNDALEREIDKIAAAIPHDDLAIQFDVASAVFARLQRRGVELWPHAKPRCRTRFSRHPGRSRQPRAARYRAALPFLLRRLQPSPCGRAHRHGRHGRVRQSADARGSSGRSISSTCRCRATAPTTLTSRRSKRLRCDRKPSCASASSIIPTGSTARSGASRPRRNSPRNFPSLPNAASAGASRRHIPELLRIHAEVAGSGLARRALYAPSAALEVSVEICASVRCGRMCRSRGGAVSALSTQ